MEDIIDLVVTDASPSEISDAIKSALFNKASEKINDLRPEVASALFGDSDSNTVNQEEE
jgi:hypothetical protein